MWAVYGSIMGGVNVILIVSRLPLLATNADERS